MQSAAGLLRDVCFNVAHWWFAYEYYFSAVSMEYIFMQKEIPDGRKRRLELLNKICLTLNYGVVIAYYLTLFMGNYISVVYMEGESFLAPDNPFWFFVYIFTRYSEGAMQLVSGVFLLLAVFKIRSFLIEHGLKD